MNTKNKTIINFSLIAYKCQCCIKYAEKFLDEIIQVKKNILSDQSLKINPLFKYKENKLIDKHLKDFGVFSIDVSSDIPRHHIKQIQYLKYLEDAISLAKRKNQAIFDFLSNKKCNFSNKNSSLWSYASQNDLIEAKHFFREQYTNLEYIENNSAIIESMENDFFLGCDNKEDFELLQIYENNPIFDFSSELRTKTKSSSEEIVGESSSWYGIRTPFNFFLYDCLTQIDNSLSAPLFNFLGIVSGQRISNDYIFNILNLSLFEKNHFSEAKLLDLNRTKDESFSDYVYNKIISKEINLEEIIRNETTKMTFFYFGFKDGCLKINDKIISFIKTKIFNDNKETKIGRLFL